MFPSASAASSVRSATARALSIPASRPWQALMPAVAVDTHHHTVVEERADVLTVASAQARLPGATQLLRASKSLARSAQVRLAHTDATRVPDFNKYRRDSVRNPNKSSRDSDAQRKLFSYVVGVGATGMATVYASKAFVRDLASYFGPAADVLALAKVEVKLGDIPEGKSTVVKWRGKPLFIRHRTAEEIAQETNVDISTLRDPQTDAERAQKPEWLVLIGVCTHLGCVPIPYVGEYRGYFCPCHGSVYDASGRIRAGPAPTNLEVPKHEYIDETTLVVG